MAKVSLSNDQSLPFYFNLDMPVGRGCPNQHEDVALVSFLMRLGATKSGPVMLPKLAMLPLSPIATPELFDAIETIMHKSPPSEQHISPATTMSGNYRGGGGAEKSFLITNMNYVVKMLYADVWPRIDKIPLCPPSVWTLVRREIIGAL